METAQAGKLMGQSKGAATPMSMRLVRTESERGGKWVVSVLAVK